MDSPRSTSRSAGYSGSGSGSVARLVLTVMRKQRPDDAGILVGESNRSDIRITPRCDAREPPVGLLGTALDTHQHGARPVNQQSSQVRIATLTDAQQNGLATRGALARHQSEPCRELPAVVKDFCIADARHQRARRQCSDPGDRLQALTGRVVAVPGGDLPLKILDLVIQRSEMLEQSGKERAARTRQAVLGILENRGELALDRPDAN